MGRADVDELLQELTSTQLDEWMAYERLEPFGHPARNWFYGSMSALVANIYRSKEKQKTPFSRADFEYDYAAKYLHPEETASDITQEELEQKFLVAMRAFGADIPDQQ